MAWAPRRMFCVARRASSAGQLPPGRTDEDQGAWPRERAGPVPIDGIRPGRFSRIRSSPCNRCPVAFGRPISIPSGAIFLPPCGLDFSKNRLIRSPKADTACRVGRTVKVHFWLLVPEGAVVPILIRSCSIPAPPVDRCSCGRTVSRP